MTSLLQLGVYPILDGEKNDDLIKRHILILVLLESINPTGVSKKKKISSDMVSLELACKQALLGVGGLLAGWPCTNTSNSETVVCSSQTQEPM